MIFCPKLIGFFVGFYQCLRLNNHPVYFPCPSYLCSLMEYLHTLMFMGTFLISLHGGVFVRLRFCHLSKLMSECLLHSNDWLWTSWALLISISRSFNLFLFIFVCNFSCPHSQTFSWLAILISHPCSINLF